MQWEGLVVCWNYSCLPLISNMDQRIYEVASHIHLGTALSTKTKQDLIALLKKPLVHICKVFSPAKVLRNIAHAFGMLTFFYRSILCLSAQSFPPKRMRRSVVEN